ncbi:uncharacterized protein C8A04DRAFT_13295 [Dichotomopilus funicola]|uniref:Uncharacterized protein n=1 Tax=Dichotomopilus funicola TaxID=1934379 RepID=A0AAN6ZLK7_9PEZI|nr:hypothetical protein C8A04DRAFT_13295 [Dichotomopilus funicola]
MLEQSKDGDRSQAPTQEVGLEHLGLQAAPQKRPAPDDELEFISSNPVKKRKSTPTQTQPGPDSTPLTQHSPTSIPSPTRLIDRCRSAYGIRPAEIRKQVFVPEPRGGSLPTFDQFAFPRFSSPIRGPPTRLSVAISPKQLPYAVPTPQAPPDTGQSSGPRSFQPAVAPQTTIAFNQIPCLDYNGVPVTSRGFDMGQIFSLPILHQTTAYPAPVPTSQGLSPSSLLQDIAHTIRSGFPYAQVAARNGTPPDKVVETVGNLVITHLLRMASQSPRVR